MIIEKKLKKALNKKVSWFFGPSLGGVGGSTPHPTPLLAMPGQYCRRILNDLHSLYRQSIAQFDSLCCAMPETYLIDCYRTSGLRENTSHSVSQQKKTNPFN